MVGRAKQRALAFFLASTLGVAGAFSQEAKKVKDQAEFDLLQLVNKEAPNTKRIELIDQWKQKYPDSEFKEDRAMVLVQTYQALGKGQEMWGACEELLAINPKSAPGLFFLMSLTTSRAGPLARVS